ncbi:MAG: TVP38/TMEM64 family protein [Hyphomicrobiaceae bacterium]
MPSDLTTSNATSPRAANRLKRLLPIGILAGGIATFFALGLDHYLTFEALREHRSALMGFVMQKPVVAVLVFILLYAVATTLSLPGGALLTVTAGFLFGITLGTAATVVGATMGAIAIYLAARTAFREILTAKAGPMLQRMEAGFKDNALSYLLVLRLIPIFPFFIVNIVPALLGVPLRTYAVGTLAGIIPGTFVFASIGAGLGSVFDRMEDFSLKGALTPEVTIALIGLSMLSLVPIVYKKLKAG